MIYLFERDVYPESLIVKKHLVKVQIFWEGQKWSKFLWPSQNIWTLNHSFYKNQIAISKYFLPHCVWAISQSASVLGSKQSISKQGTQGVKTKGNNDAGKISPQKCDMETSHTQNEKQRRRSLLQAKIIRLWYSRLYLLISLTKMLGRFLHKLWHGNFTHTKWEAEKKNKESAPSKNSKVMVFQAFSYSLYSEKNFSTKVWHGNFTHTKEEEKKVIEFQAHFQELRTWDHPAEDSAYLLLINMMIILVTFFVVRWFCLDFCRCFADFQDI